MALSFVTYTGDGSNRIFNVTFQYLLQANVYVKVNNVAVTYTWLDSSRVQLTTAPDVGAFVEVRRVSNRTTRAVDFQDGAVLTEAALDADSNQLFEMAQEAFDSSDTTIQLDYNNTFNAGNKQIKSVANPTDAQDAVTKVWAETAQSSQLALADAAAAAALVSQNAALVSQNASEASKVISTAQAVISTTKAAESLASEVISTAKSVISTDKAAIATTKAEEALASQNAASTSETNAAASLDAFDDRFLGSFATAPTVDNDNDALATGTLYWNSASSRMYAWTGSVWETLKPTNTEQVHINTVSGISADVTAVSNDATDIGVVAAKATEIGLLGAASAVADMVILGTTDVVSDMNTLAAIQANVTTVADISANVTAVANNQTNINNVFAAISDIDALVGNGSDISTLADISGDVTTVANNDANVTAIANNAANINTLVGNMASVNSFANKYRVTNTAPTDSLDSGDLWWNTANNELRAYSTGTNTWAATAPTAANQAAIDVVAGDIVYIEDMGLITSAVTSGTGSNITAVGESITEVRTVAGDIANVVIVAGDIANVNSVAGNSSNINSAVGNASNINDAVGNAANINSAVANASNINSAVDNASNINSAVGNASNINSAVGNEADITSVAGNASNINSAVANASNINSAVSNEANINSAVSNSANINLAAGSIANVNLVGGSITNVNAVAANLADINTFSEEYKISATAPAGPSAGDLWYDSTVNILKYYTGSIWENISAGIASLIADTTPQLGGALDAQNNNMTNVGTISGSNLQLDFGGL
jgi:hypothetical protein